MPACRRHARWFHAANSSEKLRRALAGGGGLGARYDAVEVDLSFVAGQVLLAHGADDAGVDTSLRELLALLEAAPHSLTIKYDFKDARAVAVGLELITASSASRRHHTIVNVAGLLGPAGRPPFVSGHAFEALAHAWLPASEVSVSMTSQWDVRTLFFAHGYTHGQARALAGVGNSTSALCMPILAQTAPDVAAALFADRRVLVWGEAGFFERAWLAEAAGAYCADRDLLGLGWWIVCQYAWLATLGLLGCVGVFCVCGRLLRRLRVCGERVRAGRARYAAFT